MAVFRRTVLVSPPPLLAQHLTGRRVSLKFIRCSSMPVSFSVKSSKRKNYLRPKIRRTLNPKPSETTPIQIETPEPAPSGDTLSDQIECVEELQVSSSSAVPEELNGISSKFSAKSVGQYGLYFLGAFAFQTVCAVWFFGNSTKSGKRLVSSNDNGSSSGTMDTGSSNRRIGLNGNGIAGKVISLDEFEMKEKIAEIRTMAREARKSEQKGGKSEHEETLSTSGRLDIEREIDARLSSMEKRLNSQRKGLAGLRVEPLDEFDNDRGKNSDLGMEGNGHNLMFDKKFKFKAEKPASNAKGFGGHRGISKGNTNSETISGAVQATNQRRSSYEAKKSRKVKEKQWWRKLPYVLRILMRGTIEEEVSEGFFTLRTSYGEHKEGRESSHVIAFEDESDARHFCYLLELAFEDLGGFSVDIVPTPTKDLYEESDGGKKVMVVKKRQLEMYAGQAFEDVERALHSLIQQQ